MLFVRTLNILVSTQHKKVQITESLANLTLYSRHISDSSYVETDKNDSKLKSKTPKGKLDIQVTQDGTQSNHEMESLKPFPNNTNPTTGEVGGPKGPEPTRYGDWERKGKVSDF